MPDREREEFRNFLASTGVDINTNISPEEHTTSVTIDEGHTTSVTIDELERRVENLPDLNFTENLPVSFEGGEEINEENCKCCSHTCVETEIVLAHCLENKQYLEKAIEVLNHIYPDRWSFMSINNDEEHAITIYFPELIITNDNNESHIIYETYAAIEIKKDTKFMLTGKLHLYRTKYSSEEFNLGYVHSHTPHLDSLEILSGRFQPFCLGKSELIILFHDIKEILNKQETIESINEFENKLCMTMFVLKNTLSYESIIGSPYIFMSRIKKDIEYNPYSTHFPPFMINNLITRIGIEKILQNIQFNIDRRKYQYVCIIDIPNDEFIINTVKNIARNVIDCVNKKYILLNIGSDGKYYLKSDLNINSDKTEIKYPTNFEFLGKLKEITVYNKKTSDISDFPTIINPKLISSMKDILTKRCNKILNRKWIEEKLQVDKEL